MPVKPNLRFESTNIISRPNKWIHSRIQHINRKNKHEYVEDPYEED